MDKITGLINKLQGFKTYMVATAAALTAIVAYLNHQLDLVQLAEALLASAGAATIRGGISTTAQKVIDANTAVAAANAADGMPDAANKPADPNDLG